MRYLKLIIALLVCQLSANELYAQESVQILTRTGTISLTPNLNNYSPTGFSNYKLLIFNKTPSKEAKTNLENSFDFLEYVPNNSFIVKLPSWVNTSWLASNGVVGVFDIPQALKLDYRLLDWDIPPYATVSAHRAKVAIIAMNDVDIKNKVVTLQQNKIEPYQYGQDKRFAYCELNKTQIEDLVKLSWVRSIELIDEPGQPESTEGRSIQKSNVINSHLSNGLTYDASGVKLLVRDDGIVGPHIDFEGRLTNLTTDATGTHGDGVAGVMGGAGNIDPSVEGGASGADISVINYLASFQDNTLSLHQTGAIMITNSSYSNGCNAGYTSTSQTVDKQVFDNPTLMHVFSAGNSNNNDCGYGAGDQWGNITGGHKIGKNVIAVANLYNDGSLASSSSRGPAHDGRIKPDMAAHGQGQMSTNPDNQYVAFGGTSAAAPSLAGNLGQLIEVYRDLNNNADPKSSLIKAAAMNSATDLGNVGPDFKYGYGMINTARAYDVLANNQYEFNTLSQADSNLHTITVPSGVGQVRIMLYWHDPEATINVNKALINDLDLTVNDTLLPLVLDHTASTTALNSPAMPGIDHLNNVEQVVIDNPAAGNLSVKIKGFQIPSGPQEYVLVYTFIEDKIKVTYPLGGESLIPSNSEIVHWDAYGVSDSFLVEYSTDNGANWNIISKQPGTKRNTFWNTPNTSTSNALVRVSRLAQSDVSDETFNIFPVPQFTIQNNSSNSVILNWPAISGATKYYIWQLGNKYMEIIDSSTTNSYVLGGLVGGENLWLSVSANSATITGERANAQNFVFDPLSSCNGCISSISTFPYFQSFESGFGSFCQSTLDNFDFSLNTGGTPTNSTGPTSASDGSTYIYAEASSPNNPLRKTIIASPCFDFQNALSAHVTFDYHMYGNGMGTLEIQISTDGGLTWNTNSIWSKTGDQGNQWNTDSIDLSIYKNNKVSFRFSVRTGTSARSDIAIDNIIVNAPYPLSIINQERITYTIQPNPSDGLFHLNTIENLKNIQVINSYGQVIKNIDATHLKNKTLNLQQNAPGIYFLILSNQLNQQQRLKISKY